ncbi:Uncharacterized protein FWK35_00004478 [Aphis craccivora]|uniref:Uncharacterized protein n=1 Tax=Aphis craccivora TaxID=307492 RepID=A0A6G0ZJU6_APHCR|nr:Uncharacterized protein FWK35_00004478 [Aphis craccivora]
MISNESIIDAELNGVIKDTNATTDILSTTDQLEEVTVEVVVDDVIEDLLMLVCDSLSGDAPPETLRTVDTSLKGTSAAVEGGPIIDVMSISEQREEDTVEMVINDVIEELLMLVCDFPSGDVPPETLQTVDTSLKGTSAAVDGGPQGDAAIPVNHVLPDNCVKEQKHICELDGYLDPIATPQQRAPRRQRGFFTAVWKCVKRVVCGVCCLRCGYPFEDL